jgi:membrane protein implicated in regulation of membrane protease activity
MNQPQQKQSSTFGIIAIVISIIAFGTPRFLISMVLIALAAFIIIGFVRDGNKIFSGIALAIGAFLLFMMYQSEVQRAEEDAFKEEQENATYTVKYETVCVRCDVRYTNETGGTDEEKNVPVEWSQTVQVKGTEFIHLSAQNDDYTGEVYARIKVNNRIISEESSKGAYAVASVSCQPKDINGK